MIIREICSMAKEYAIAVSFGFIEKDGDVFFSSQMTIDKNGQIIDLYRRVSPGWKESFAGKEYCEGDGFHTFHLLGRVVAIGLCGDLWYEENITRLNELEPDIIALIMALAMILTLVACGNSNGDNNNGGNDVKAIQLSLGHTNNTDHHYQVLAESFKKIVEEKSNGQLIINIFPAEQLGSGSEMLESVKSGTQDMVLDPDAYLANYDPLFNVIAMPYVFTSWDHVLTFADSDVAATLNTAIEKQGMTILGWAANGFRVVTSNNEINSPADFSGLKVRVGSAKLIADMLTALNANPTTLSMSDTYSGLQTGIVSAQENPTSNIIGSKFYEVQKYLAVTHHQYVSEPLIMNKAKFDSLSPELQQILLDAAKEVCAADVKTVSESEASDLKFIEEQGVTITYPDLTAFEEALAPVTESYCKQYGDEFTALYNQLKG